MTVNELTRELGAAIQASPEYERLCNAKKNNDEDLQLQDDIKQLNLIRIQYNSELSKESGKDEEKIAKYTQDFKSLYAQIMRNPNMTEYNAAKEAIDGIMNEITTILTMCVNGEDPFTCEPPHGGCSGDCSSCGSCH